MHWTNKRYQSYHYLSIQSITMAIWFIKERSFAMRTKYLFVSIISFAALLLLVSSCILFQKPGHAKNDQEVFGQVGFIREQIVGIPFYGSNFANINDFGTFSERIRYDRERYAEGKGPAMTFRFLLKDVHARHPRYHELFDVRNYRERKPWIKTHPNELPKSLTLCLASFEKVTVTANCSFGEEYPVGSDLSPLATFMFNDYASYVEPGFDDDKQELHYIKGDDKEAWKKVRLSHHCFSFFLSKKPDWVPGQDLQLTFTFELIDRLASDGKRMKIEETFTFYRSDNAA